MTVRYGFHNSVGGDRRYNALDMGKLFDGIITDGVIAPVGNKLTVSAGGSGLSVIVNSGRAWFRRTWIDNDSQFFLALTTANVSLPRIDTIVIVFDSSLAVRRNSLEVRTGTPGVTPVPPTLVDTAEVLEIPLADVYVGASVTTINDGNITNRVGLTECPFASGVLQQFSIADLWVQWEYTFDTWLQNLMDQLDDNQATNLQNQIDQLVPPSGRNCIINGDFQVLQRDPSDSSVGVSSSGYFSVDRWRSNTFLAGTFTWQRQERTDFGVTRKWLKITTNTTKPIPDHNTIGILEQRIEGNRLTKLKLGQTDARWITVSFLFRSNVTGTYVVSLYSATNTTYVSLSFDYTTVDTTQKITLYFSPNSVTQFNFDHEVALAFQLWLIAGPAFTSSGTLQQTWGNTTNETSRAVGQVNLQTTVGNYVMITDIQVEPGKHGTEFERLPYQEVLALCRRYLEVIWETHEVVIITMRDEDGLCRILVPKYMERKRIAECTVEYLEIIWRGSEAYGDPGGPVPAGIMGDLEYVQTHDGLVKVFGSYYPFAGGANKPYYGQLYLIVSCEL